MKNSNFIVRAIGVIVFLLGTVAYGQTSYHTDLSVISSSYTYGANNNNHSMSRAPITYVNVANRMSAPFGTTNNYVSSSAEDFIKETTTYNKYSGLFIGFDGIKVAKLHPISDEILETWETKNYAVYSTDARFNKFSYEEYNSHKKLVKSYTHTIITHKQDEETHTLVVRNDESNQLYRVLLWKDGSMVILEAKTDVYLVTGEYEILRY